MSKKAKTKMTDEKDEAVEKGRSVAYWCKEIDAARKREKKFRKLADEAVSIYEAEKAEELPFNILYANTETLQSALYNSIPKPIASRRFKDADPLGKVACEFISRYLEFFIDSNDRDYSNFDEMITAAVAEGLVPGRGLTRFKYEAEIEDTSEAAEGEPAPEKKVTYENVCGEEVPWNRFYHGYARRWTDVPWLAFEHFMSGEEVEKNFKLADLGITELPATITEDSATSSSEDKDTNPPKDMGKAELVHIYEIWDKDEKEVVFICPDFKDKVLKKVPDPLGLSGFYPTPKPLAFGKKISSMLPVPLYAYYKEQANELNRITIRINKIIRALKVRGFYDSTLEGIQKVLEAGDNVLVPVENAAAMQQGQTLEKSIWLMPIEKLINVLQQLYLQRTQVKSIIYEITAIADIMRGASQASETLGAQQIKTQWGSLRLKTMQKEVARYVRDCLRIAAEIGFSCLSAETLMEATNIRLPSRVEKQQAAMAMQQQQAMFQQQVAMSPPPQPGQAPPQPPPVPPQVQQILSTPAVEDVMELLKNDIQRQYKIDIETDSTIAMESAGEKQEMGEALNAIAQFLNGSMPLVQEGILPFEVMKSMLLTVVRRFKFGTEIEDEIAKMQAPPPKPPEEKPAGPDPAVEMQKLEMAHKATAEAKMFDAKQEESHAMFEAQKAQEKLAQELASKERIEQMRLIAEGKDKQAQRQADQWKLQYEAATKIVVAKIAAESSERTAQVSASAAQAISDEPQVEATAQEAPDFMQMHLEALNQVKEALMAMQRPRTIVKDANGRRN